MNRKMRQWVWGWALVVVLLVVGGPCAGWAATPTNTFPGTGNVGIGTTTPTFVLDVLAPASGSENILRMKVADAANDYFLLSNGTGVVNRFVPVFRSHIESSNAAGFQFITDVLNTQDTGSGALTQFYSRLQAPGGGAFSPVSIRPTFQFINNATAQVTISANGNVGIGTAAPTAKLDVHGDINVTGNINAKYQDVAEWVPTKSALPPGTVVIIDPQATNEVLPAAQPYDTRVAGVVSARPGLLLGEEGEGKVKVAHMGRVPVKVDALYGPIAVGDLLVTSPTSGCAMRSTPVDLGGVQIHRPGTLVGKALEPLTNGQGEILVLLTLQ